MSENNESGDEHSSATKPRTSSIVDVDVDGRHGSGIESSENEKPTPSTYALSSTISSRGCILLSTLIILSHALFIWGQADILWAQVAYTNVDIGANATSDISQAVTRNKFGETSASVEVDQSVLIGSWSYGGMLNELWAYSKITAVFLFLFSALWPHLKLVLLHVYLYRPA
eukprot:CAMPEP_0181135482 /NCGR_PEP_ID=MMETSP1071-20121207/32659_1 /TAXON_ID=35127 /ORGANISM="Thalassiosira sp., Strain NH16" /LENGTH=170 /DNA_ID=CAMNT_0023222099 /DNA_START=109 /DNA_END=618 /DNA_ORIENTATION=+